MRAFFCLLQTEARTTHNHVNLVLHPQAQERVNGQGTWYVVHQRQHVRREVFLQLRVLVQVVQHDLGNRVALQDDDQPLAGTSRGLVTQVSNTCDLAVFDIRGDLVGQRIRVHHVWKFSHHQARASLDLFHFHNRTLRDRPTAGTVCIFNSLAPQNGGAVGEVRSLNNAQQRFKRLFVCGIRVRQQPLSTCCYFPQVVRRNVRGHTHRNTGRTVDQQVREPRRQVHRLLVTPVVVVLEVDRVFFDVTHHLQGQWRHLAFGVTRSSRPVITSRTEVTLPVNERVAHGPRLNQTHQCVVDRGVTVWVVLTHHVTHNT